MTAQTPATWDGMRALARYLASFDEDKVDYVTIGSATWAREVMPGRTSDNLSVLHAIKETLRALPYNEAGCLERVITDRKGWRWQVRAAKRKGNDHWKFNFRRIGSAPQTERWANGKEDHI